jgi:radical SAM protein with 4Fe4S-binding SPASM domain
MVDIKNTIDNFIEFLNKLNSLSNIIFSPVIHFTGGDPILHPDLIEAVGYASSKFIKVGILGNPDHLNIELIKNLYNNGLKSFQITLDGLRSYHDLVRESLGLFEHSCNMVNLLNLNNIKTVVLCNVSNENIDQIVPLYKYLTENTDLFGFAISRIVKTNFINVDTNIETAEYKRILTELLEMSKNSKVKLLLKDPLFSLLANNIADKVSGGCQAGISLLSKMSDGSVYACRRLLIPIGKHPSMSFYDIYVNSDLMKKLRNFNNYEKCKNCEIVNSCRGCPAVSFGIHGDSFKSDPQCWK